MLYILDACTIINILHIDDDEFLLKALNNFNFSLCQQVYAETEANAFHKLGKIRPYPQEKHDLISDKLKYFRPKVYSDQSYLDIADSIASLSGYGKKNGEFFSITLSFYINTFEKSAVFFVTDDYPAKEFFAPILDHHKAGCIYDGVDLLVCLYRHVDNFTKADLKKMLSSLYSEYASHISEIGKKLNSLEIPRQLLRNKDITYTLQRLRAAIANMNLHGFTSICNEILSDQKRYAFLYDTLKPFLNLLSQKMSNEYLEKIKHHISFVEETPFYKFVD